MADIKRERFLPDDISSLSASDSNADFDEIKDLVEEETVQRAHYEQDELEKLVESVKKMVVLFRLEPEDFTQSVLEVIERWLVEVSEPVLCVFFDEEVLHATLGLPTCPVADFCYFNRSPNFAFTSDNFHDEIVFGTLSGDTEGSLLAVFEVFYAPTLAKSRTFSSYIKHNSQQDFHEFVSYLTETHFKLSGLTKLYIPCEGAFSSVEESARDPMLVKRLESVVTQWTEQVEVCLSDVSELLSKDMRSLSDEHEFWLYKHEVLSFLSLQLERQDLKRVLAVLETSESFFLPPFLKAAEKLEFSLAQARANFLHIELLLELYKALDQLDFHTDLPIFAQWVIEIMHMVHFVWGDSTYYHQPEETEKLLSNLSLHVIKFCTDRLDLEALIPRRPKTGIRECSILVTWCLVFRSTMMKLFVFYENSPDKGWFKVDEKKIFHELDSFVQGLRDLVDICDGIIAFGTHEEHDIRPVCSQLVCSNAVMIEEMFDQIGPMFDKALGEVLHSIDHVFEPDSKPWFLAKNAFQLKIREFEETFLNSLVTLLGNVPRGNIEEVLQALTALNKFSGNLRISNVFANQMTEIWKSIQEELALANKLSSIETSRHAMAGVYSGQVLALQIRFERLQRILGLMDVEYLPFSPLSQNTRKAFDEDYKTVQKAIKNLAHQWKCSCSNRDLLGNFLLKFKTSRGAVLSCNMDETLYMCLRDSVLLEQLGAKEPETLIKIEDVLQTFKNSMSLALDYNKLYSVLSNDEEQLFHELLASMRRKLSAGVKKFKWTDNVDRGFFVECTKALKEVFLFTQLYKKTMSEVAKMCEGICDFNVLSLESATPLELEEAQEALRASCVHARHHFEQKFGVLDEYVANLYDRFSREFSKPSIAWLQFVLRVDNLFRGSVLLSIQNSLDKLTYQLTGSGGFKPAPIISFSVVWVKKTLKTKPPISKLEDLLALLLEDLVNNSVRELSVSAHYGRTVDVETQEAEEGIVEGISKLSESLRRYLTLWSQ